METLIGTDIQSADISSLGPAALFGGTPHAHMFAVGCLLLSVAAHFVPVYTPVLARRRNVGLVVFVLACLYLSTLSKPSKLTVYLVSEGGHVSRKQVASFEKAQLSALLETSEWHKGFDALYVHPKVPEHVWSCHLAEKETTVIDTCLIDVSTAYFVEASDPSTWRRAMIVSARASRLDGSAFREFYTSRSGRLTTSGQDPTEELELVSSASSASLLQDPSLPSLHVGAGAVEYVSSESVAVQTGPLSLSFRVNQEGRVARVSSAARAGFIGIADFAEQESAEQGPDPDGKWALLVSEIDELYDGIRRASLRFERNALHVDVMLVPAITALIGNDDPLLPAVTALIGNDDTTPDPPDISDMSDISGVVSDVHDIFAHDISKGMPELQAESTWLQHTTCYGTTLPANLSCGLGMRTAAMSL